MSKSVNLIVTAFLCLHIALCVSVNAELNSLPVDVAEQRLREIIALAENNRWQQALESTDKLCADYPEFRAAQRLQQLVTQQRMPEPDFSLRLNNEDDEYSAANLDAEIKLRLQTANHEEHAGLLPDSILRLDDEIHHAIVVDLDAMRLFLLRNISGDISVSADYYAGIGKQGAGKQRRGDLRTPVGIYDITHSIPDAELDELYGAGALPLNYPNAWDKRLKRSGSGIWIHGVPRNTYSRPPYSSLGCVTVSNYIYRSLLPLASPGKTPVILDEKIDWIAENTRQTLLKTIENHIQQWQNDWASLDFDRYIAHYSRKFHSDTQDLHAWTERKRAVNRKKTFIRLNIANISIYRYPGETSLLQVDYRQQYESNNFVSNTKKRQYWLLEDDGRWRIVYEGLRR